MGNRTPHRVAGVLGVPGAPRLRAGLGVRLMVAFLVVIALGTGSVAVVARRTGGEDFRSYVAARGMGPPGTVGPAGTGPGSPGVGGMGMMGRGPAAGLPMHVAPEEWFLDRLNRSIWTAAAVGGAGALLLSLLIARRLTQPVRALRVAARRMAAGDLEARVHIRTGDELEELGDAFDQMADSLQRQEQARRALVANVAHDLRTPLAIIRGTVDAMLDGVYQPAPEHLRSIREETDRLARLVGDLRDLSLADAGQLRLSLAPLDVGTLVERAADRARRRAGSGVTVETLIDAELPPVQADDARLAQALDNVLENALRYTPAGGVIRIAAAAAVPGFTAISIQDTGPGIAPEHLPHVFERFYRGDAARSRQGKAGSGLGLAIVRGIVEAHGGTVWAERVPEAGARFWLTLPVSPAGSAQESHNFPISATQPGERIGTTAITSRQT